MNYLKPRAPKGNSMDTEPTTDELRATYRRILNLRAFGVMTELDADELVKISTELLARAWILNADESDWIDVLDGKQPPAASDH